MRYFVTNRKDHLVQSSDVLTIISDRIFTERHLPKLAAFKYLALDTETTGLDPWLHKVILVAIGSPENQYIIDAHSYGIVGIKFMFQILEDVTFIGHALKFDYSMLKTNFDVTLTKIYDTMLADQRIWQGMGYRNGLNDIKFRYIGMSAVLFNKEDRLQFVGQNPATYRCTKADIDYTFGDIADLFTIKYAQLQHIYTYNLEFLLYEIEFPLVAVVAEAELEGVDLNVKALKELVEANRNKKYELECKLDKIVRDLRDDDLLIGLTNEEKAYLHGGMFDRPRAKIAPMQQFNMFAEEFGIPETDEIEFDTNKGNINWNSPVQIVYIFGRLGLPLPTESKKYLVPEFGRNGKVLKNGIKYKTGEKEIMEYLLEHPYCPGEELIKTLIDYREVSTELSRYGNNLIDMLNPKTGRLHTIYRTCHAVNGRFQSGGGKKQPDRYNSQNFPKKKEFRILLYRQGYKIQTIDLAGAEVTVMAAKANDEKLFNLAMKGDIHSHMGTLGWRAIYRSRKQWDLAKTYTTSKTQNKDMRDKCKNNTFASVYGVHAGKAGKTIGVIAKEGAIYINVIKSEIPDTFEMVETNVELAFRNNYLIIDNRTHARIWFPDIIEAKRLGEFDWEDDNYGMGFSKAHDADGQARNIPISGTQANLLKEAMVRIDREYKQQKWDSKILLQVHDELVIRHHPDIAEIASAKTKEILCNTANLYLETPRIKMDAEYHLLDTWIK